MVSCEASAVAHATPEQVWEAWTDVGSWAEGEHAARSAELKGEPRRRPALITTSRVRGFPASTLNR